VFALIFCACYARRASLSHPFATTGTWRNSSPEWELEQPAQAAALESCSSRGGESSTSQRMETSSTSVLTLTCGLCLAYFTLSPSLVLALGCLSLWFLFNALQSQPGRKDTAGEGLGQLRWELSAQLEVASACAYAASVHSACCSVNTVLALPVTAGSASPSELCTPMSSEFFERRCCGVPSTSGGPSCLVSVTQRKRCLPCLSRDDAHGICPYDAPHPRRHFAYRSAVPGVQAQTAPLWLPLASSRSQSRCCSSG
jgi:hypothetical protein